MNKTGSQEAIEERIAKLAYRSPVGDIELIAGEKGLLAVQFTDNALGIDVSNSFLLACKIQLDEYFEGKRFTFDLPLDLRGTAFQKQVWLELIRVPFGETVSYLHIAKKLGDPNATRAVGFANGKNPFSIVVPCHRVIGVNGSLVGYAGGIEKKKWLLAFERNFTKKDLFNSATNEAVHG
jgi:methylated-DNA-[protein]-cysteine S-methyltransferase